VKLDKDLVRDILLAVEEAPAPISWKAILAEGDPRQDILLEHLKLVEEPGFITGTVVALHGYRMMESICLTYKGHEFLDTIRDNEVWRRTKSGAEKAGVAGIGFVVEMAKAYGKQVITERLGIALE
jgi:Hypothetical protein (DUF2513)